MVWLVVVCVRKGLRGVPKIFVRHGGNCYNHAHSNFCGCGLQESFGAGLLTPEKPQTVVMECSGTKKQSGLFLKFLSVLVHCA